MKSLAHRKMHWPWALSSSISTVEFNINVVEAKRPTQFSAVIGVHGNEIK
jgi:hypothetical protein